MNYVVLDIETTGLDPVYGDRITCICGKTAQQELFCSCKENEREILEDFIDWIEQALHQNYLLVTHVGKDFDLKFIWTRAIKKNICDKRFDNLLLAPHFDLSINPYLELDKKTKRKKKHYVSLDEMAALFGFPSKYGNGLRAIHLWDERRLDELQKYCGQDVLLTEQIYLAHMRMKEENKNGL